MLWASNVTKHYAKGTHIPKFALGLEYPHINYVDIICASQAMTQLRVCNAYDSSFIVPLIMCLVFHDKWPQSHSSESRM